MSQENRALFIVDSPFQCLCMLEAIHCFNLTNVDIIVTYSNDNSLSMIDKLLKKNSLSYQKLWLSHLFKDTVPHFFRRHKYYNRIFIGNYCSPHGYVIGVLYAKRKANMFFMDDGNQVLSLFSNNPPKSSSNWKVNLFMSIVVLLHKLKRMGKDAFFTIYDIQSKDYKIYHNNLNTLRVSQEKEPHGVYIIGTNTYALGICKEEYEGYLSKIASRYNSAPIFYCPHRQDKNNQEILSFCKTVGISVFFTEISVEYDFINKGIYPSVVLGFCSNALYTIHHIYSKTQCLNIVFDIAEDYTKETYMRIREGMEKVGIKSIIL